MNETMTSSESDNSEQPQVAEKIYRYPGLRSFGVDKADQKLFFGREKEIHDLFQMVRSNRLIVLYGKSGLGKTSLLQAGVFPRLQEIDLLPLRVRLNEPDKSPMEVLEKEIQNEFAREQKLDPLLEMNHGESDSWWEYFKTTDFWRGDRLLKPVLILDQFEEIFKLHSRKTRGEIAEQLSYLVNGLVPSSVLARFRKGETDYSESPPDVHVVLSLRIENVGQLQELFPQIPAIFNRRFNLLPMDRAQALDAIVKPAAQQSEEFITRSFRYQAKSLDLLMDHLVDKDSGSVEPYQLQLQCHHIERQVEQSQKEEHGPVEVDDRIIRSREDLTKVVTDYYLDTILDFGNYTKLGVGEDQILGRRALRSWRNKRRARSLCEHGLLSGQGDRLPLSQQQITNEYALTPKDLDFLVERRLLRREQKLKSYLYELSHDSLAQPIYSKRSFRVSNRAWFALLGAAGTIVIVAGISVLNSINTALVAEREARLVTETARTQISQLLADYLGVDAIINELEMVEIPPGSFMMGSENGDRDERPPHRVTIDYSFALSKTEITFEQYDIYALATGQQLPGDQGWGRGSRPVVNVSWNNVQGYIDWLNEQTGGAYRLPSEAEWEYAARAGTDTEYSWGDEFKQDDKVWANCDGCGSEWDNLQTAPVASFEANDFGLFDMHGNVWEWVQDCYEENYANASVDGSAYEGGVCRSRVLRGGSWYFNPQRLRSALRYSFGPTLRNLDRGFRLAQDL